MGHKTRIYARVLQESLKEASLAEQKRRIHVFKGILKKRGDMKISRSILEEFRRLQKEQAGKIGEVVSAKKLPTSLKMMFAAILTSMKFVLEDRVDPAVLGGVAVFLGKEFLIDNTIRGRIRKMATLLHGYHE